MVFLGPSTSAKMHLINTEKLPKRKRLFSELLEKVVERPIEDDKLDEATGISGLAAPGGVGMAVKTERKSKVKQPVDKRVPTAGKPASIAKNSPPDKRLAANFSAFVLSARKSLGVTQSVFGRLIGVSERSISGWELGKPVNQASLRRIEGVKALAGGTER